jgi:ubiquinone/menaquinone biosynthesis C-methylase UbiE
VRLGKDWHRYVRDVETLGATAAFERLRDEIVARAEPRSGEVAVDVGAGGGLLTFALAPAVRRVYAVDLSGPMCEHLRAKVRAGGLGNVEVLRASATDMPLEGAAADLVVSNYTFHLLPDADKRVALSEVLRVLRPGGRLVFADMMFRIAITGRRNRTILVSKSLSMARRGPAGLARVAKNALRFAVLRGGRLGFAGLPLQPADAAWWREALAAAGFEAVSVELLEHEGGIAMARRAHG